MAVKFFMEDILLQLYEILREVLRLCNIVISSSSRREIIL